MLKSPTALHPHSEKLPTRLVIFWAHNPERSDRVLKKMFMHYKIDLSKPPTDKISFVTTPRSCPIAEWKFKVSHYKAADNVNVPASSTSAAASSSSAREAKTVEKITLVYALQIPTTNNDYAVIDSQLNTIVKQTFELISGFILNYNLNEIIFVNEANLFFSSASINMLPEIKDRFMSTIKLCSNPRIKEQLAIVDFSTIDDLAAHEQYRLSLHQKQKIPFVMGFQEGGGGSTLEHLGPKFKEFFNFALDVASMPALNRLSMALLSHKILFNSEKFTQHGTSFAKLISQPSTPKEGPSSSASPAALSEPTSSPSSTPPRPLPPRAATPKYPNRALPSRPAVEGEFLSEPLEWPSPTYSHPIAAPLQQDDSPSCLSTGFSISNSPFVREASVPLAPRSEDISSLNGWQEINDLLISRNSSSLSLRRVSETLTSRNSPNNTRHPAPATTSPAEVSTIIAPQTLDAATSSAAATFFSPKVVRPIPTFAHYRPAALSLLFSSSMPTSPIAAPVTHEPIEQTHSYPATVERKPIKKQCPTEKDSEIASAFFGPGEIPDRSISVGEGELIFRPNAPFFSGRRLSIELERLPVDEASIEKTP